MSHVEETLQQAAHDATERDDLWITLAECWLDNELTTDDIQRIADVVRRSGISQPDYWALCRFELGPFLCYNGFAPAGVWDAFDHDWVTREARKRHQRRGMFDKLLGRTGITLHPAKVDLVRIDKVAFSDARQ